MNITKTEIKRIKKNLYKILNTLEETETRDISKFVDYSDYMLYIETFIPDDGINKTVLEALIYKKGMLDIGKNKINSIISWLIDNKKLECIQTKGTKIILKKNIYTLTARQDDAGEFFDSD